MRTVRSKWGAVQAKTIILDEPSQGLAPLIYKAMFDAIRNVRDREGLTVLMVEQNAVEAMRISDYLYVMQLGQIVAHGSSVDMREN